MKKLAFPLFLVIGSLLGTFLIGCSKSDPAVVIKASDERHDRSGDELVILNWEDYLSVDVIEAFEAETGIQVHVDEHENLGDLVARLKSHPDAYDLVVVDDVTLNELVDVKLLQKIDHQKLTNFRNFDERYTNQDFDPGNQYSVPYLIGTTLIAYREDHIQDPEQSWNLLWDESLRGKVAMIDEQDDIYAAALLSLGHPLDSEDPEILKAGLDHLLEKVEKVQPLFRSTTDIQDLLLLGKVSVACLYSGDAALIAEEDENISYFIPKEGAPLWMDNLAIARDSDMVKEAHTFIDFLSRGDMAAENANYLWYPTPNQAATPHLDPELVADQAANPPQEILNRCNFHAQPSVKRIDIVNAGMKKIFDWAHSSMAQNEDEEDGAED